ncbi:hypothetical protein [Bacillus sp. V5-8f]|uniref:hypothetical protein n=1 Tax=Bacillus sp. V5-8f TaxID=2053044 RepID=UPI00215562BD|nr:hypothetical protein [Bacillus sp. V5-8f]
MVSTFNKDIDVNTINTSNVKLFDDTDSKYVPVTLSSVTVSEFTVGTPTLVANHEFRLELGTEINEIADLAGNKFTATFAKFFYGLTPVTVTFSPANGGTNVYPKITASGGKLCI